MDLISNNGGYNIYGAGQINIILGKNGCGKSTLLRQLDKNNPNFTFKKYVSPERGGELSYDAGIENNLNSNPNHMADTRRNNQSGDFRRVSMTELGRLEKMVLRQMEQSVKDGKQPELLFDKILDQINSLLDNVEVIRPQNGAVKVQSKKKEGLPVSNLSSGEAELVSLSIEILSFSFQKCAEKESLLLLLDEPDAHLHPDLQEKLMDLLVSAVLGKPITVFIATHSTAILSALSKYENVKVTFMHGTSNHVYMKDIKEPLTLLLPAFGAHPLTAAFNKMPLLIVEGEDDERIWQQVVRSSQGKIKLFPVVAGSLEKLAEYEEYAKTLVLAIYDNARVMSLRDRDSGMYFYEESEPLIKMSLNCYAAENLMLSDDVIQTAGFDWTTVITRIEGWLDTNKEHEKYGDMVEFKESGFDRRNHKIKDIRNILSAQILLHNKSWEIEVGQRIAALRSNGKSGQDSLVDYLGPYLVRNLNLERH